MRAATRLLDEAYDLGEGCSVHLVAWLLDAPLAGSAHRVKYRLAYVVEGACVLRYDNEAGKGDHRHVGKLESAYAFESLEKAVVDFWNDVSIWDRRNRKE